MYSRSLSATSRNHRTKGTIKVKHILQICLLAAICFWLMYQVKPSHEKEKEKEIDGKEAKLASEMQSNSEILRLGRKDVSRATETIIGAKLHEEENRHVVEEERASVESRIGDREDEEFVDKPEEDKIDDEVQDNLLLDEDKVTDEDDDDDDDDDGDDGDDDDDDDDDDSERKDQDPDNLIAQEYVSSENPTVLREFNDQSQRSNNLTESESKQSKTHSNFTRNVNISLKASLGSSGEEVKADDDDGTDMEEEEEREALDYSGYAVIA